MSVKKNYCRAEGQEDNKGLRRQKVLLIKLEILIYMSAPTK